MHSYHERLRSMSDDELASVFRSVATISSHFDELPIDVCELESNIRHEAGRRIVEGRVLKQVGPLDFVLESDETTGECWDTLVCDLK